SARILAGPLAAPPVPSRALVRWCGPGSWLVRPPGKPRSPPTHGNSAGGPPWQQKQRVSGDLREKQNHMNSLRRTVAGVAALPACWLAPAPGANSPESALGVGPRLPRGRRPGHPRFWRRKGTDLMGPANPGPFLDAVSDLSGIATYQGWSPGRSLATRRNRPQSSARTCVESLGTEAMQLPRGPRGGMN